MPSYDEHLAWLVKQEVGSRAERQGFQDAKLFDLLPVWTKDKYEQGRYADGFFTGKEKIRFDRPVTRREGA